VKGKIHVRRNLPRRIGCVEQIDRGLKMAACIA